MKHLKLFENNTENIYLVQEFDEGNDKIFAFVDIESRDNFLINHIHEQYAPHMNIEEYNNIMDIFSIDELLSEYNTEHNYIELETVEIQKNVKLKPMLQLRKDKLEYNL